VTDKVNITSVNITVLNPAGAQSVANFSTTDPWAAQNIAISLNSTQLAQVGDYLVNVSATDAAGNVNDTTLYLEVYTNVLVTGNLTDAAGNPVAANLSFFRPNTTELLASYYVDGPYSISLHNRKYDVVAQINNLNFTIANALVNGTELFKYDYAPGTEVAVAGTESTLELFVVEPELQFDKVSVYVNYTSENYLYEPAIQFYQCPQVDWSYVGRTCPTSDWAPLSGSILNILSHTIVLDPSSGAFALSEDQAIINTEYAVCGSGVCETQYGENCGNCPEDCGACISPSQLQDIITAASSGASSGASSSTPTVNVNIPTTPDITPQLNQLLANSNLTTSQLQDLSSLLANTSNPVEGQVVSPGQSVSIDLYPGESTANFVAIQNTLNTTAEVVAQVIGSVAEFIQLNQSSVTLTPGESVDFPFTLTVPANATAGVYSGSIAFVNGNLVNSVPVVVRVLQNNQQLLDLQVQPLTDTVAPGDPLRAEVIMYNLGQTKRVDVELTLQMIDSDTNAVVNETQEAIAVDTSVDLIRTLNVPPTAQEGKYILKADASYSAGSGYANQDATSLSYFTVQRNILDITVLGIPVWVYLCLIGLILFFIIVYWYIQYQVAKRRRYVEQVDYSKLPKAGLRTAFMGTVAESKTRAFFALDKLTTHALDAGATGSGKTVAAQVLAEEALKNNIAVVVFDPTAQWTGFLRPQKLPDMLSRYKNYGMKESEARAFDGNIRMVTDPLMPISVKDLLKPGTITVFVTNKLQPKEIDLFYANTVRQVFAANLEESSNLRLLLIYDEVHRLLPKFGGSGEGFVQIERGAREFRKWGVGILLISQVLSDFVSEIKANIGTEIQMRTKYEGDLDHIRAKYGENTQISVVRATVGTGMIHNSEYNNGVPYFVSFRPLLHNITRLSDAELTRYAEYNQKVEEYELVISALKDAGTDVLDLELELNLSKDKIKKGTFNIVDIYLEGLQQHVRGAMDRTPRATEAIEKKRLEKKAKEAELRKISEESAQAAQREISKRQAEAEASQRKVEELRRETGASKPAEPDKPTNTAEEKKPAQPPAAKEEEKKKEEPKEPEKPPAQPEPESKTGLFPPSKPEPEIEEPKVENG
jgi:hypothetical protein